MSLSPIIKWVGGKTELLDEIFKKFPTNINNYYEPFIGGGSVFLRLLDKIENHEISINGELYLSDKNQDLINLNNLIKNNVNKLIKKIETYKNIYDNATMLNLPKRHKFNIDLNDKNISKKGKQYVYYYYRELYNSSNDKDERACLLLFLNKTCYRGLYRVSKNGFNVPFGNYKNPSIYSKDQLLYLNLIYNKYNLNFECKDFLHINKKIKKGDFVYFDPPYYPINDKSFASYQSDNFTKSHIKLVKLCFHLNKNSVKFLLSNSSCKFTLEKYKKFNIQQIKCSRRINSKKPTDWDYELLIWN